MKQMLLKNILLSFSSALLLSVGFLFPHCGGFALVGFVPLLWMDAEADAQHKSKCFFLWHYLTFVLWNAMTTYWVCNATVGGGIFAITANALQMSIIWSLFRLSKRLFSQRAVLSYILLATLWIAWEKAYFDAEVSWPWLTLGNSFAGSTTCIQWYEYTGVLGGSLWVWACNLAIFRTMQAMHSGEWTKFRKIQRIAAASSVIGVAIIPLICSWIIFARLQPLNNPSIQCAVLQPNFDPYEKFESLTQNEQNGILADLALEELDKGSTDLLIAPETFCNDVFITEAIESPTASYFKSMLQHYPATSMLMGASSYEFIHSAKAPSYTAVKDGRSDIWHENHNSALMFNAGPGIQIYHKNKLVVGVEKMPWPRVMSKVDDKLGNVMGRCVGQDGVSLLYAKPAAAQDSTQGTAGIPLGCAICYESVYPMHFASFVKKGAQAMTIITNDAWWGDTPGYRQHLNYARLRAIETRRDIARCANTGISAFINHRGDIVAQTPWWERSTLRGELRLSSGETAFVRYGDIVGRLCSFIALLLAAAMMARLIQRKK